MIGFDVLMKAIALAGSAISTKRANDEAEGLANKHYSEQQAYFSSQANSDAMATTAAKATMGAIDKSEQREQERERNMREVTGGTEMASIRSKQMASDARAAAASNIHLQQQQQKLKYDEMLQKSRQAEYEERQARINAKRQSAQNMVQNAMQLGAMAGSAIGESANGGVSDSRAAKSLGVSKGDMYDAFDVSRNSDGSVKVGGDGTAVAYAKSPAVSGVKVTGTTPSASVNFGTNKYNSGSSVHSGNNNIVRNSKSLTTGGGVSQVEMDDMEGRPGRLRLVATPVVADTTGLSIKSNQGSNTSGSTGNVSNVNKNATSNNSSSSTRNGVKGGGITTGQVEEDNMEGRPGYVKPTTKANPVVADTSNIPIKSESMGNSVGTTGGVSKPAETTNNDANSNGYSTSGSSIKSEQERKPAGTTNSSERKPDGVTGGGVTNSQVEMDDEEGRPGRIKATSTANPVVADTSKLSIKSDSGAKPTATTNNDASNAGTTTPSNAGSNGNVTATSSVKSEQTSNPSGTTGGGITTSQTETDNMEGRPGYVKAKSTANPVIANTTGISVKSDQGGKPAGMSDLRWRALQRKARSKAPSSN